MQHRLGEQKEKIGSANMWTFCGREDKIFCEGVLHHSDHAVYKCVYVWVVKVVPGERLTG